MISRKLVAVGLSLGAVVFGAPSASTAIVNPAQPVEYTSSLRRALGLQPLDASLGLPRNREVLTSDEAIIVSVSV